MKLANLRERISTTVTIEAPFSGTLAEVGVSPFVAFAITVPRQPAEPGAMLELFVNEMRKAALPIDFLMAHFDASVGMERIASEIEKLRLAVEGAALEAEAVAKEMARLVAEIKKSPVYPFVNFHMSLLVPPRAHVEVRCGSVPVKLYLYGLVSVEVT